MTTTVPLRNKRKTSWKRILPGLAISVIALAVVLYLADLRKMVEALRLADYRYIALVALTTLVWLGVRTLAWRTLLQEKATFSQVFLTLNEGYLLNNVLPFRLGEVGRAFLLGRKANIPFFEVLSTILIERGLDIAFAVGLLLSTLPFVIGADWALQAAIAAGGIVLAGLVGFYLLARNRQWALDQFEKIAHRWPRLGKIGSRHLPPFLSGLSVLTDGKRFLRVVGWIALDWLIGIVQYYLLLLAFFPTAKLLWAMFALGVLALGIAVPSSPGSVGVLEAAMVGALSSFGLDLSTSLAAALMAHLTQYLVTGVIGIYALARDGLTLTGLYKDVQDISPGDLSSEDTTPDTLA